MSDPFLLNFIGIDMIPLFNYLNICVDYMQNGVNIVKAKWVLKSQEKAVENLHGVCENLSHVIGGSILNRIINVN